MAYDLATGKKSFLFSPEIGHHGDEDAKDDSKKNVSDEGERTAGIHGGWRADGADPSASRKEADGESDAET
jgi:hypothetical protein